MLALAEPEQLRPDERTGGQVEWRPAFGRARRRASASRRCWKVAKVDPIERDLAAHPRSPGPAGHRRPERRAERFVAANDLVEPAIQCRASSAPVIRTAACTLKVGMSGRDPVEEPEPLLREGERDLALAAEPADR